MTTLTATARATLHAAGLAPGRVVPAPLHRWPLARRRVRLILRGALQPGFGPSLPGMPGGFARGYPAAPIQGLTGRRLP